MRFDKRILAIVLLPLFALAALIGYGPIEQLAHYHEFADRRAWHDIPNAADVLSNSGFALIGALGLRFLWKRRKDGARNVCVPAYSLFFVALIATAAGSSWYHLAPDNARLVWDRLPIALACVSLVDAVLAQQLGRDLARRLRPILWTAAPLSVFWWRWTDLHGAGDLRLYLFLQALPLALVPLLLLLYPCDTASRRGFGLAIGFYIAAKLFELYDHRLLDVFGWLSGHTLKHVFATLAALCIYRMLYRQNCPAPRTTSSI